MVTTLRNDERFNVCNCSRLFNDKEDFHALLQLNTLDSQCVHVTVNKQQPWERSCQAVTVDN